MSARLTIKAVIVDNAGDEITIDLPAKHAVCRGCEGHGTRLREAIASHAYTSEEFYEAFSDEEARSEYFRRGGRYDVQCWECSGRRVVVVVDRAACTSDAEREALRQVDRQKRDQREVDAIMEAERRYGGES